MVGDEAVWVEGRAVGAVAGGRFVGPTVPGGAWSGGRIVAVAARGVACGGSVVAPGSEMEPFPAGDSDV